MNIELLMQKRAIDVTVEELATVIALKLSSIGSEKKEYRTLRGIPGIMEIAQCSRSKASRLRSSGILNSAITNVGRDFLIDEEKAIKLLKDPINNRKYIKGLKHPL